tara:strand:- start:16 stop:348 length:333 start_codon:yes stop_codon:yes gene_type:complete
LAYFYIYTKKIIKNLYNNKNMSNYTKLNELKCYTLFPTIVRKVVEKKVSKKVENKLPTNTQNEEKEHNKVNNKEHNKVNNKVNKKVKEKYVQPKGVYPSSFVSCLSCGGN